MEKRESAVAGRESEGKPVLAREVSAAAKWKGRKVKTAAAPLLFQPGLYARELLGRQ